MNEVFRLRREEFEKCDDTEDMSPIMTVKFSIQKVFLLYGEAHWPLETSLAGW